MTAYNLAKRRRRRNPSKRQGSSSSGNNQRRFLIAAVFLVFMAVIIATSVGSGAVYAKHKYDEFVSAVAPPQELLGELPRGGARIYDRNGLLLYEFIDDLGGLRRPVPLSEISEWLVLASISTEDSDFWVNNGLNVRGLVRAAWENFSPVGGNVFEGSGGSSITQQLAKNVYIPREERLERSVQRKLKEAAIAIELTNRYSKEQILEWYLNSISYGGIYVGIEAAAQGYFGKTSSELTLAESTLLAGIPQQPALYDPFQNLDVDGHVAGAAKERQQTVLNLMVTRGYISKEQAKRASDEQIALRTGRFEIEAPHFVLGRVASEIEQRFGARALFDDGLEVVTSLNMELQTRAEELLELSIIDFEESSNAHNGAVIVLDPHTGQILVYIGSRDYFRDDIEGRNDNIISLNSPGSTLKPFTYMTAFMEGWSTGTGIIDAPFQIIDAATGEPFEPRNPIKSFQVVIPANKALGNSLNIPAFKVILAAGVDNVVSMLKEVGITTLDNPLGYGPALTLGGVDITLEDLTFAYSVLTNEGIMRGQPVTSPYDPGERTIQPVALLKVTDADGQVIYEFTTPSERRVVASNFAWLVTSILSDGDNQCITFGICNALALPGRTSAAKTGTSEPFEYEEEEVDDESSEGESSHTILRRPDGTIVEQREIGDTWAFGYTPELVTGIWAGNSDNEPMVNIFSTSISWRLWHDFMVFAHEHLDLPATQFRKPPGVIERELCWPSGRLPSELCPRFNRYTGLFAEDVLPRNQEELATMVDDWWRLVHIDSRTGLLATDTTPSAFVIEDLRLALPRDEIYLYDEDGEEIEVWEGLQDWATQNGIAGLLAPTESSSPDSTLVRVIAPSAAKTVSDTTLIVGTAASPDFQQYVVEWRRDMPSTPWIRINTSTDPVPGGILASWDTLSVPNGSYSVRVVLTDEKRGDLQFIVPVIVDNGEHGNAENIAPRAQIYAPLHDSIVSGTVTVVGTTTSGSLLETIVEIGPGLKPSDWMFIGSITAPTFQTELTRWDTTEVQNGTYTLRVTVVDQMIGSTQVNIVVTVANEAQP